MILKKADFYDYFKLKEPFYNLNGLNKNNSVLWGLGPFIAHSGKVGHENLLRMAR